ncbi:virulence factor BrkB family protein [Dokdonella sp. MW10]|uniref:virulence factor BrkB family protein n=1 Tax=Dokdonella sp. MW10 TaxID=2992926 RepID=UPI003F81CF16
MRTPQFAMPRFVRERHLAFLRFTWKRFVEDRCLQTAGALSYTTLFALVPLTAAILGVLAAFPVFAEWREQLTSFAFRNFVPAAGDVVQGYLTEFAANASKATAVGVLVLLFSSISLMMSIEDTFNRIWRVGTQRRAVSRFVIYWTALSLGPLLVVAALVISSYVFALPLVGEAADHFSLRARLLSVLPFVIQWVVLLAAYVVIPNRTVRLRDAAVGALIAAVLFEAAKRGFAWYATGIATYQQVYGALAMVPIFILWIYLSWIIVLLGASITASATAFDYRPRALRLQPGQRFAGLLRVVTHLAAAHREGRGLHSAQLREAEPALTDDLLQRFLDDLDRLAIARRTESGEWVLARDLAGISLLDVYREADYRLPVGEGDLTEADAAALRELAQVLRGHLAVPVAAAIELPARAPVDARAVFPGTS